MAKRRRRDDDRPGGAAADPSTLWTVVSQMEFGRIWSARLALSLLALLVAILRRGAVATAILAGVLLTSLALTGHARDYPGGLGLVHVAADAAHLLAAAHGWVA